MHVASGMKSGGLLSGGAGCGNAVTCSGYWSRLNVSALTVSRPSWPRRNHIAAGYLPVAMALSITSPIRSAAASTSRSLT